MIASEKSKCGGHPGFASPPAACRGKRPRAREITLRGRVADDDDDDHGGGGDDEEGEASSSLLLRPARDKAPEGARLRGCIALTMACLTQIRQIHEE